MVTLDNITLENYTPHTVTLMDGETAVRIPQQRRAARCRLRTDHQEEISFGGHTWPVVANSYGEVYGLPEPKEGTRLIVSRTVASALAGTRNDLLVPNDFVFDDRRHVIGCRTFMRIDA